MERNPTNPTDLAQSAGMRLVASLVLGAVVATGCSGKTGPRSVEHDQTHERPRLVDKYQDCMKKAETDAQAVDCGVYRESADALD